MLRAMPQSSADILPVHRPLSEKPLASAIRWLLAALGLVFTACAIIGALVPGLPVTIFVILASFCFTRSCPWLEKRLLRIPLFAKPMAIIDGTRPFTRRARIIAATCMWLSVLASCALIFAASGWRPVLHPIILLAAVAGTICIALYKRSAAILPTS